MVERCLLVDDLTGAVLGGGLWRGQVALGVRGVTAPQRTGVQPPIWELAHRSGVCGASLFNFLG